MATLRRVGVAHDEAEASGPSGKPSISADGSAIVFQSFATNLVPGGVGGAGDIFLRFGPSGDTRLVSVATSGYADGFSYDARIASSGTAVAFTSFATNLVAGDGNGTGDVFVRRFVGGPTGGSAYTERVSVASDGSEANGFSGEASISTDGRFVAFTSYATNLVAGDANGRADIFLHDRWTTRRVSMDGAVEANGDSELASVSYDGRYVAFQSRATNLGSGPDGNGDGFDIFVRDMTTGVVRRVTGGNGASTAASFATDGDYTFLVFQSEASDLVAGDANGVEDVFLWRMDTGATTRVSLGPNGAEANGGSYAASVSGAGRYVSFTSSASNLVADDANGVSDVFVHEVSTGRTLRVSGAPGGPEANDPSGAAVLSHFGDAVVFQSSASNLVDGDANGTLDVFAAGNPFRASEGPDFFPGTPGNDFFDGKGGNDTLLGGAGADTLLGGSGDDRIDGGAGADSMVGGTGDDRYYVDDAGDVVVEAAGEGAADKVVARVSWTMTEGSQIEQAFLSYGAGRAVGLTLAGNALDNKLTGYRKADTLLGGDGRDTLDGGEGADSMAGGAGDDVYTVDSVGDVVDEGPGGGTDRAYASVDWTLGAGSEVEHLYVSGAAGRALSGNERANYVTGGAGADTLAGGGGDDRLYGGDGADVLVGGAGADSLFGQAGPDTFRFLLASDSTKASRDRIMDFDAGPGGDLIDLRAIDAVAGTGADDAFSFIGGAAFTGVAGQLRVTADASYAYVMADVDGDRAMDFVVAVLGAPTLAAEHFLL